MCLMVTVAPGSAARVSSMIVPTMVAPVLCAALEMGTVSSQPTSRNAKALFRI
jgi:hypothetical protein